MLKRAQETILRHKDLLLLTVLIFLGFTGIDYGVNFFYRDHLPLNFYMILLPNIMRSLLFWGMMSIILERYLFANTSHKRIFLIVVLIVFLGIRLILIAGILPWITVHFNIIQLESLTTLTHSFLKRQVLQVVVVMSYLFAIWVTISVLLRLFQPTLDSNFFVLGRKRYFVWLQVLVYSLIVMLTIFVYHSLSWFSFVAYSLIFLLLLGYHQFWSYPYFNTKSDGKTVLSDLVWGSVIYALLAFSFWFFVTYLFSANAVIQEYLVDQFELWTYNYQADGFSAIEVVAWRFIFTALDWTVIGFLLGAFLLYCGSHLSANQSYKKYHWLSFLTIGVIILLFLLSEGINFSDHIHTDGLIYIYSFYTLLYPMLILFFFLVNWVVLNLRFIGLNRRARLN